MQRGWGRGYTRWYKQGWWCPRHPWPPAWARTYCMPPTPHHPAEIDPREELKILEAMKKDLDESLRELEARIRELRETVKKEKNK